MYERYVAGVVVFGCARYALSEFFSDSLAKSLDVLVDRKWWLTYWLMSADGGETSVLVVEAVEEAAVLVPVEEAVFLVSEGVALDVVSMPAVPRDEDLYVTVPGVIDLPDNELDRLVDVAFSFIFRTSRSDLLSLRATRATILPAVFSQSTT